MEVYTCNLALGKPRQVDLEFQSSLGYEARPCLKGKREKSQGRVEGQWQGRLLGEVTLEIALFVRGERCWR